MHQTVLCAAFYCVGLPVWSAVADVDGNIGPQGDQGSVPRLFFEPIPGLTTERHYAPSQTAIPLGTVIEVFLSAPQDAQVTLSGAEALSRNDDGIMARCQLDQVGPAVIEAVSVLSDGTTHTATSRLDVVAIDPGEISATISTVTVSPFNLQENATNEETMSYYYGESVAHLVETTPTVQNAVGLDGVRRRPAATPITRRFSTSINRNVDFRADVNPPAFAPLMEWRIDGDAEALGTRRKVRFSEVGQHAVSVGPPGRPVDVVVNTYSVSITSHQSGLDFVGQGVPITFEAVTDPPGHEDGLRWISSTKYGVGSPVVGQGSTFTVQFDDTFGPHEVTGDFFQWLGVRADNARFGQDQKVEDCCTEGMDPFGTNANIPSSITFGTLEIPPIPPDFFGPGSDPVGTPTPFTVDVVGVPRTDFSGVQCGSADTFVRRLGPVVCPGTGFPRPCDPVPIEMASLSLTGTAPVTVTFNGGQNPELWQLAMGTTNSQATRGVLNADLENATGGTYTATLPVRVTVALVRDSALPAPGAGDILSLIRTVDMGLSTPVPWTRTAPADGGFFCPPQGFDVAEPFFPGEPGSVPSESAVAGIDCDTCISCSGAGCHGRQSSHFHCICRPIPCPSRCQYDVALSIPFPVCTGPPLAPSPLISAFVCNTNEPDATCCGSPGIPMFGIGLFPCLGGGASLTIYTNSVLCVP